ncbi:MAG: hypothetical protein Q4D57_00085 [Clostridia bacterium]|nr:hypothetical protein [Clostridia bacterium]
MKKFNLPDCPYCRSEAGYFDSFIAKNKEAHRCTNCGRVSKVGINTDIFRLFIITQIISIIAFVFAVIMGGRYCLFGLAVVVLCAIVFYAVSPFMVKFSKWRSRDTVPEEVEIQTHKNHSGPDSNKEIYSN